MLQSSYWKRYARRLCLFHLCGLEPSADPRKELTLNHLCPLDNREHDDLSRGVSPDADLHARVDAAVSPDMYAFARSSSRSFSQTVYSCAHCSIKLDIVLDESPLTPTSASSAGRYPLHVQPRYRRIQAAALSHVRRHQLRMKRRRLPVIPMTDPRHIHPDRSRLGYPAP